MAWLLFYHSKNVGRLNQLLSTDKTCRDLRGRPQRPVSFDPAHELVEIFGMKIK